MCRLTELLNNLNVEMLLVGMHKFCRTRDSECRCWQIEDKAADNILYNLINVVNVCRNLIRTQTPTPLPL